MHTMLGLKGKRFITIVFFINGVADLFAALALFFPMFGLHLSGNQVP
jgi:hypothetical protein